VDLNYARENLHYEMNWSIISGILRTTLMSSQTLTDYFNAIISSSQQFINELPDEFLHDASKRSYQLISEIKVYLRS
jgi:hypothetical protein